MKKERDTEHVLSFKEETVKRLLIPILIIPLLALVLIGCEQDMRNSIADFLSPLGKNAYIMAGLVELDTENQDKLDGAADAVGTGARQGAVANDGTIKADDGFGVEVTGVPANTKYLAPQKDKDARNDLKNIVGDATGSDDDVKQANERMKEKITSAEQKEAAKGTVTIINTLITNIQNSNTDNEGKTNLGFLKNLKLEDVDEDNLTKGDMVMLQLMTDMVANTVETLLEIVNQDKGEDEEKDVDLRNLDVTTLQNNPKIEGIINDALSVAEAVDKISGATTIDFLGDMSISALLDAIPRGRNRMQSRTNDGVSIENVVSSLLGLSRGITKEMMGAKIEGGKVKIEKYRTFLLMMSSYRSSLEFAFSFGVDGEKMQSFVTDEMRLSNASLIKYLLAVAVTEHDSYIKYYNDKKNETKSSEGLIEKFLDLNRMFVTGDTSGLDLKNYKVKTPDGDDDYYEEIYGLIKDYLNDPDQSELNDTIKRTLLGINAIVKTQFIGNVDIEKFDLKDIFNINSNENEAEGE